MFKRIQIVGNLGKDPEIRSLQSGGLAGNFSVAVNEKWTNRDGEVKQNTTWFNVVAYQNGENGLVSALIKPYLRQGQLVFIDGDPSLRKGLMHDGSERWFFEIKLGPQSTIKMLGGGKRREEGDEGFDGRHRDPKGNGEADVDSFDSKPAARRQPAYDDDIPF